MYSIRSNTVIWTWSQILCKLHQALSIYYAKYITAAEIVYKVSIKHKSASVQSTTVAQQHNHVTHLCLLHLIFPQTAQLWPSGNSSCWYDYKIKSTAKIMNCCLLLCLFIHHHQCISKQWHASNK